MFGFALLALVASAAASSIVVPAPCPAVTPVDNFNLEAYATGKWYEVGRYPHSVSKDGNCGWAEYVLKGDTFSVKNFDIAHNKLRFIGGSAQVAEDAGKFGKLTFSYPYGAGGALNKYTLWILGTDYNSWAVAYYCDESENKQSRQDYVFVFSRVKKPEDSAISAISEVLKQNSFIDISKFIWPEFSDKACSVTF